MAIDANFGQPQLLPGSSVAISPNKWINSKTQQDLRYTPTVVVSLLLVIDNCKTETDRQGGLIAGIEVSSQVTFILVNQFQLPEAMHHTNSTSSHSECVRLTMGVLRHETLL